MKCMNSTAKFLIGFLAGALTGASLGLLMAPEKGEDARKLIKNKVTDLGEKGKEVYSKYKKKKDVVETETESEEIE